jgi:hypothetical protein
MTELSHPFPLNVDFFYGIIRLSFKRKRETEMLLEDLKQQLDNVKGGLETLRRHL